MNAKKYNLTRKQIMQISIDTHYMIKNNGWTDYNFTKILKRHTNEL